MAHGAGGGGDDPNGETRRDFLMLATGTIGAFGVAAVAWPFIDQMNPAADVLALATTEVDISKIEVGQSITVLWRGHPVFIRRRTPEEIKAAEDRLKKKGYANVNEDLLFESIIEMREIEEGAERLTKKARRKREKRNHQPSMPVKVGSQATQPTVGAPPDAAAEAEGSTPPDRMVEVLVDAFDGIVEPD